jgi:hypothetical protein
MKNLKITAAILALVALAGFVLHVHSAFGAGQVDPNLLDTNMKFAAAATKACLFPVGGWTIVDCSNVAAAQSGQLDDWTRYVVQCGVNSYIAWGDAATDEADANDGYIPAGSWLEFMTDSTSRYFSCLNIGSDSDCRYIECR